MKNLQYAIDIKAPAKKVYDDMLGATTYSDWTSAFSASSRYEGTWEKGGKILFIGSADGEKKEGMIAEIAENIPAEFVSIRHYGVLDGEEEITEGPRVEPWANSFENYTFTEKDGLTTVSVAVDTDEKYIDYFNEKWPIALDRLKKISES